VVSGLQRVRAADEVQIATVIDMPRPDHVPATPQVAANGGGQTNKTGH